MRTLPKQKQFRKLTKEATAHQYSKRYSKVATSLKVSSPFNTIVEKRDMVLQEDQHTDASASMKHNHPLAASPRIFNKGKKKTVLVNDSAGKTRYSEPNIVDMRNFDSSAQKLGLLRSIQTGSTGPYSSHDVVQEVVDDDESPQLRHKHQS